MTLVEETGRHPHRGSTGLGSGSAGRRFPTMAGFRPSPNFMMEIETLMRQVSQEELSSRRRLSPMRTINLLWTVSLEWGYAPVREEFVVVRPTPLEEV